MDIKRIEQAAELVFKICERHPEICPHEYEFYKGEEHLKTGEYTSYYKCTICGATKHSTERTNAHIFSSSLAVGTSEEV